jgi:UDP-N-acetylglucosamine 2-epimerase (non-hydrolysing)
MIVFCLGTLAELIKCFPVMSELERLGCPWLLLSTRQSPQNLLPEFESLGFSLDRWRELSVPNDRDLSGAAQALKWFFSVLFLKKESILKDLGIKASQKLVWIVHGDTLSTLAGAWLGRRMGARHRAHIEAGMRTKTFWSPFPEEINRRLVTKMVNLHYATNPECERHLQKSGARGQIINVPGNTQIDAFRAAIRRNRSAPKNPEVYAVANLHRFENLNSAENWAFQARAVLEAQRTCPVLYIMHPQTKARLEADPAIRDAFVKNGVRLMDRMSLLRFAPILNRARFLLTDSGGNQDDAAVCGIPTLILREHTESSAGMEPDGPCVLSEMKGERVTKFLKDPEAHRRKAAPAGESPSQRIAEHLKSLLK